MLQIICPHFITAKVNKNQHTIHHTSSIMQPFLYPIDKFSIKHPNDPGSDNTTKTLTSWESMSPYVMAEYIAELSLHQQTPTLAERRGKNITIDTSYEHTSQDSFPDPPTGIRNLSDKSGPSSKFLFDIDDIDEDEEYMEAPRRSKRLYSSIESNKEDEDANLEPFDPSFLMLHNPHEMTARLAVTEIMALARKLESSKCFGTCRSSYKRFRNLLLERSINISVSNKHDEEKQVLFNNLYSDSLMHMKALVQMSEHISSKIDSSITLPQQQEEAKDEQKKFALNYEDQDQSIDTREFDKKCFTRYMNKWLKNNWTNPYPDDEGLSIMAAENGTTETIISNWLINARTRKWRPSIVKAFELGRPADMLMEDSIRIFDGENVDS